VLFIIATASLAFLGAGVQAPAPEWGAMMFEGQTYLGHAWWITIFPGAMLALSGIGLSLVADALLAEARR
jgi:peptide/nickel transport system permease protein